MLATGALASAAQAEGVPAGLPVPAKAVWRVTSSSTAGEAFDARLACDDKLDTRWSSAAADPQWLQFDFGSSAAVGGVTLHWEEACGRAYRIETATDTSCWTTVYETEHGGGGTEEIYFSPVTARFLRLVFLRRGTAWGYSLWEVDVKGGTEAPLVSAAGRPDVWFQDGAWGQAWIPGGGQSQNLIIDLQRHRALNGVRVGWGGLAPIQAHLAVSADRENWYEVGEIRRDTGTFDMLSSACLDTRYLRLTVAAPLPQESVAVNELALLRPIQGSAPLLCYACAAARAQPGLYPDTLRRRQVYWTVVGQPGDTCESLLDEYGTVEPVAGGSSMTPFLCLDCKVLSALDAAAVTQGLVDGALPLPSVAWHLPEATLTVESLIQGSVTDSVNVVRYTVTNTNTSRTLSGELFLAVRPIQVNPVWQHGGLAEIRELACVADGSNLSVRVNGRDMYIALSPPDEAGVCPFDEGDIAEFIRRDVLPTATAVSNTQAQVSGAISYRFDLAPGASRQVVVGMPLHGTRDALNRLLHDEAGQMVAPGAAFDGLLQRSRDAWHARLERVVVDLPDRDLTQMLRAQTGWMLINSDGPALEPGSRNYKRVWIRDGAFIAAALLRMGQSEAVRDFLDWYAARVQPDGLAPPILNPDGSVYRGLGDNREYDSQGEFVFAIMEYYRFTHDRAFLLRHFDAVQRALRHLEELRTRTLRPDDCAGDPLRARYAGILPASISHEGYATPVHSYWDDWFALKGWKDGRAAALALGHADTAAWAGEQYGLLRSSLRASLARTMDEARIGFIPGCAELADRDPSSTSVAFFPCEEDDLLPRRELEATYEDYYGELVARTQPGWEGVSTPYEARNANALVRLDAAPRAQFLLRMLLAGRRPASWQHVAEVLPANPRQGVYIGDMPHSWAGADLVTAVRNLLVYEQGERLVLLAGIPEAWVVDASGVRVERLPTYFGALDLTAREQEHQLRVEVHGDVSAPGGIDLHWPFAGKPRRVMVNGAPLAEFDARTCHLPGNFRGVLVAELPGDR